MGGDHDNRGCKDEACRNARHNREDREGVKDLRVGRVENRPAVLKSNITAPLFLLSTWQSAHSAESQKPSRTLNIQHPRRTAHCTIVLFDPKPLRRSQVDENVFHIAHICVYYERPL
jgi:hypothetical protein